METSGDKKSSEDIYEGYKAVLDSKSTDETQVSHPSIFSSFLRQPASIINVNFFFIAKYYY